MRSGFALFWMVTCTSGACAETGPTATKVDDTRGVSARLSHEIRAGLPAYHAADKSAAPPLFDTPHDGEVLQLAKIEVWAKKSVPDDSAIKSALGFAQFLRRRYPGASVKGQDPYHSHLPNYAAFQHQEDERLRRLRNFKAEATATPHDHELNDLLDETFLRRSTWQEDAMDRSYNQNRR